MTEERLEQMLYALGDRIAAEQVPVPSVEALQAAFQTSLEAQRTSAADRTAAAGPPEPQKVLALSEKASITPLSEAFPAIGLQFVSGLGGFWSDRKAWNSLGVAAELIPLEPPVLKLSNCPLEWRVAAEFLAEPDQPPASHPADLGPDFPPDAVEVFGEINPAFFRLAAHVLKGQEYLGCILLERRDQ